VQTTERDVFSDRASVIEQRPQSDHTPETAILESRATEIVRLDLSVSIFRHENNLSSQDKSLVVPGALLTGLRIPGTAALAIMADQMIQFGAVR
jgi:hypothetical protein